MTNELVKADSMTVVSRDAFDEMMNNAVHKAKRIATIVNNQELFTKIGDKKHLDYEAWLTVAASYGCRPSIESVTEIKDDDGACVGYMARACLMDMASGTKFSFVEHLCSREETSWANRDRYAILSMAETRAASKACRMAFSWVVVLAGEGYATTPSEEMIDKKQNEKKENDKKAPDTRVISEPQMKRLFAIARGVGLDFQILEDYVKWRGFEKVDLITRDQYDAICNAVKDKDWSRLQQPEQQEMPGGDPGLQE